MRSSRHSAQHKVQGIQPAPTFHVKSCEPWWNLLSEKTTASTLWWTPRGSLYPRLTWEPTVSVEVTVLMQKMATTLCSGSHLPEEEGHHKGGWGWWWCWWWWWWWGSLPGSQSSIISHPHSTGTRLLLSCLHIPGMTVEWVMSKSMSRDSWWRPGWHYVPIWWISGAGKLHL